VTRPIAKNSCFSRGFTLIELLVVLAVISILMGMVYPMYLRMSERAKATKDMSNLRQIGLATQTYLNDTDGVLFSPGTSWMSQLTPKYLSVWRVFQSAFDKRSTSEFGDATTAVSYGVNPNIYPAGAAMPAIKITKPSGFILFAPAEASGATLSFQGTAASAVPGVGVLGIGGNTATSTPGGNAIGGTHNSRQLVTALFGDFHCENMTWSAFTSTAANPGQPNQWTPYIPYP
jgi:prepilin-type N-terminal cleavage/methylation domain-containing protein